MTSGTLLGTPTDPMLDHALEGVQFPRSDISVLPTVRVPAVSTVRRTASLIHETPTRVMTRVTPTIIRNASGLHATRRSAPSDFVTGKPLPAMCGHDTLTPMWDEGHSSCPACWAKSHCRADYCTGVPLWGDRCGYWWCAEHEGGAVLMTLGGDLGYPTLEFEGMSIFRSREEWLHFTRKACFKRHDLLRAAILYATRARLLRPGQAFVAAQTEEEEDTPSSEGQVAP